MKITRVKLESESPAGFVESAPVTRDGPITRERPMVELQSSRRGVALGLVQRQAVGSVEVRCLFVSGIRLGRPQVCPIGARRRAGRIDNSQSFGQRVNSRVGQELPDDHFRSLVVTLAEAMVPNPTLGVDEVKSGPVMVGEGAPDL